jgi:preprotein translocase subunit SecB
MDETSKRLPELYLHPVELLRVVPLTIQFRGLEEPDIKHRDPDPDQIEITMYRTKFDEKKGSVFVVLGASLSRKEDKADSSAPPYEFRIDIVGEFRSREPSITKERLEEWSQRVAPFVLFPYLRSLLSDISGRCGYRPLDLPLLSLPTRSALPSAAQRASAPEKPTNTGTVRKRGRRSSK